MLHALVALTALCVCAEAVDGVSFLKLCNVEDRSCLKESAQAAIPVVAPGIPELGMQSLDPMFVDKIVASQAGLNMDFRKTTVTGLKGCRVESVKLDKVKNKLKIELHCDVLFNGDYTLSGRLLILPVEGNGEYSMDIKKIMVKLSMDIGERKGSDGKTYWHVTGWKHSYKGLGGAVFKFQNLFNGNKALSDAIHTFANTNWQDILGEVGPPIVKVVVSKMVESTEALFSKVPKEELTLQSTSNYCATCDN